MGFRTKLHLGNGVILMFMIAIAIIVYISISNLIETSRWVNHTHEVMENGAMLEKYLVDMETGERGFLIAGEEEFLEPYSQGRIKYKLRMAETKQLVIDNPAQLARLEKIDEHVNEWIEKAANPEIAMRRKMNKNTATFRDVSSLIKAGTGKNILDGLRANFDEFINIERKLLHEREKAAKDTATRAIYATIFGTIFAVFLGGVISVLINRQLVLDVVARERITAELVQLIDTANAPIFGTDNQGRVTEWNQTTAKITGYSKEDVMGRDLVEGFINAEYKELVKDVLDDALKGVETANYEFPLNTKDGKRLEILLNATSRRDLEGNIIGVIGIGQDVTGLREKEAALHQAQKMEAVGQLTGGIAHDFNNLLSIIIGNLRFLKNDIGETNDAIDELFEDAMSAADDGAELTQRLLAFSRNRALRPEDKNVNDTIEKFVRFLSRTLGESIELAIDLPDEDLFIHIDPSQLENALLNLSLNARDAMLQGGRISYSATRYHHGDGDGFEDGLTLSEDDYIKISITDTGSGINPEELQHVYEPFFTTKEVGKGSGLGLSMVWGFTQQSGGSCHIKSTLGEGTTVSMYFPEVPESKMIKKAKVVDELTMRGSEVILVVEDEPRVRRVALRDLKKMGYKTLEAENADIAREIIESGESIDLLFSDVLMPGEMNGHMLGVWVEENHPDIKVVLTSGYSKGQADADRDQAHPFPMLRKPYTVEKLAKVIRAELTE